MNSQQKYYEDHEEGPNGKDHKYESFVDPADEPINKEENETN